MYTPYEVRLWLEGGGGGGEGLGIAIQKKEIDYIKIKIVPFIINLVDTTALDIHRFKSKKGASVSEEFALFNWSFLGYMRLATGQSKYC